MGAVGDDPPGIDHDDPVGALGAAEPVGDDDRGAAGEEDTQRSFDVDLGLGVQIRRGLVENDDRRVHQERPTEGDELALPRREAAASLPDRRVETIWQRLQPLGDAHGPAHVPDLAIRRVRLAVAEVVPQRPVEEEVVLGDERGRSGPRGEGEALQVVAVDRHGSLGRVVEAQQQLGDRRLPRPGLADDGEPLAGRHVDREVLQHHQLRVVAKGHLLKCQRALCR